MNENQVISMHTSLSLLVLNSLFNIVGDAEKWWNEESEDFVPFEASIYYKTHCFLCDRWVFIFVITLDNNSTLEIRSVSYKIDTGAYKCIAKNTAGISHDIGTIVVESPTVPVHYSCKHCSY